MPDWKQIVYERLASLRISPMQERDLTEEIAQHLDDRYRELLSGGMNEPDARRQAASELENLQPIRAILRRTTEPVPAGQPRADFIQDLGKDLRYAARTMRSNPLFVVFVVLTLGLGIGANTTVFTLINTLLLNPLPVQDSSSLAAVSMSQSNTVLPISNPNFRDYQTQNQVFSALAGYSSPRPLTLQTRGSSERIFAELVTGNYFSTLGIQPVAGRFFSPDEDTNPGTHPVAVMNYATWQRRFGAARDIAGTTLRVNNVLFTVIGVAPPNFIGINAIFGPDLWIPSAMAEQLLPNELRGALDDRAKVLFQGVGRLKPGVSRVQAQANLATIAAALARQYPEVNQGRTASLRSITDAVFQSGMSGSSPIIFGSVVLLVVVGLVLLIACSNVANLLLARSASRRQEIAVRVAMGASRGRLVRQLLTESVALALLSGMAGLLIGYEGVERLWSFLPPGANFITPKLDFKVFAFTLMVSLMTGLAFGIIPALRASRVDLGESLKEEARTLGRSRNRITFANVLLGGQVAFSFVLLATAGLFLRSIGHAYQIDPGFQTEHLIVLMTNPGQAGYTKFRTKGFYKGVRERVASLPGVDSVSWSSNLPLWARVVNGLSIEGREQRSRTDTIAAVLNVVDLQYFETAGVGIDQGRGFTPADREDSIPVAIVNEKLADDSWPGQSAIGKRIQLPNEKTMRQVVGVARTANYSTLAEPPQGCVYVPLEQAYADTMTLWVRTRGDPGPLMNSVRREVAAAGPEVLADGIRTGRRIVNDGLFQARVGVTLLSVFGLLALALASVGLYGIMAYSVSQRRREIGLRMALGAARSNVLTLILRQALVVVAAGVSIGFAGALLAGRLLSGMLFGVRAADPVSLGVAATALIAVALVACLVPARRASRLDPLGALRES